MLARLLPFGLLLGLAACTETTDPKAPVSAPKTSPAATEPATPTAASAGPGTAQYAGEYSWGDPKRKQAGGSLTVYPESDSTVLLYFDISNGPPAFHLGMLLQRAVVRGGVARCAFKEDYDEKGCRFTIAFTPQAASVKTEPGYSECGFGQGVYADETYQRTSSAIPQQFINGEGTAIKFKGLDPAKYQAGEY
jgi:hypothetical protein